MMGPAAAKEGPNAKVFYRNDAAVHPLPPPQHQQQVPEEQRVVTQPPMTRKKLSSTLANNGKVIYRPLSHPDLQIDRRVVGLILPGWFFDKGCLLRMMPLDCIRIIILLMKCYRCTKCGHYRDMKDLTLLSACKLRLAEKNLYDYPTDVCCALCKMVPRKNKLNSAFV